MKKIVIDKKKAVKIVENVLYPIAAMAIVLALWAIISAAKGNPLVLPMPDVVLRKFFTLGGERGFWLSVLASLIRTVICFVTSFALALLFAALATLFSPLHKVLSPMISILRAAPTVAVILILYAFIGSDSMAIVVGGLIAFPLLYSAFYSALCGVDKDLLDMAKLYKVKPLFRVTGIYLPSIAECLFDTSKSALSLTFKVVIAAEILTNVARSIGGKIQTAYASFDVSYLLAYTLVAIVFGFVLEGIVAICKKIWKVARCKA